MDVGCGISENTRNKHEAIKKAKKDAVTDARKRALRIFGNGLGNCVRDKVRLALPLVCSRRMHKQQQLGVQGERGPWASLFATLCLEFLVDFKCAAKLTPWPRHRATSSGTTAGSRGRPA